MSVRFFPFAVIGLVAAVGCLAGFVSTSPVQTDLDVTGGSDWDEIAGPVDYSPSLDRFVLEVAELQLFGKSAAIMSGSSRQPSELGGQEEGRGIPRLLGIAVLDGERVALLTDGSGAPIRVANGGELDSGWLVSEIDLNFVTITRSDGEVILNLYKPGVVQARE
ncbi:hypothetical protein [Hyphomonas sp.]|uniref:hypothetical protein n=1 Tax=Hyphomonas sp. TaxID=87 RepID=UPI003563CF85